MPDLLDIIDECDHPETLMPDEVAALLLLSDASTREDSEQ